MSDANDNTLTVKRNRTPVQRVDRARGYMFDHGRKYPVPTNSDVLLVPVLLPFKINESQP